MYIDNVNQIYFGSRKVDLARILYLFMHKIISKVQDKSIKEYKKYKRNKLTLFLYSRGKHVQYRYVQQIKSLSYPSQSCITGIWQNLFLFLWIFIWKSTPNASTSYFEHFEVNKCNQKCSILLTIRKLMVFWKQRIGW